MERRGGGDGRWGGDSGGVEVDCGVAGVRKARVNARKRQWGRQVWARGGGPERGLLLASEVRQRQRTQHLHTPGLRLDADGCVWQIWSIYGCLQGRNGDGDKTLQPLTEGLRVACTHAVLAVLYRSCAMLEPQEPGRAPRNARHTAHSSL